MSLLSGLEIYPGRRKIYRKVWGEDAYGDERNAIGCHIRKLRGKLYKAEPNAPFTIRCVREEVPAEQLYRVKADGRIIDIVI